MKRIVFLLTVLIFGISQVYGQEPEIVYGTVRTDGFQKVIKGALWSKRPEAKLIYEGSAPDGFSIHVLETNCFVRFVDGEHNNFDRNYIVVPAGEKIYEDGQGKRYLAVCGNQIEYIRSVDLVRIIEKPIEKESGASTVVGETKELPKQLDLPADVGSSVVKKEPENVKVPDLNLPPVVKKKTWPWIVAGAAVLAGTGIYFLTRGHSSTGGPVGVEGHDDGGL